MDDYTQEEIDAVISVLAGETWELAKGGRFRDGVLYVKELCRKPSYRAIEVIEDEALRPIVNAVCMVVKMEDGTYTLARFWTDEPLPGERKGEQ